MDELIALIISWIFFAVVYFKKQRDWKTKKFYDKVNFSLNDIVDGSLTMRTIDEKSAEDVWMNDIAKQEVLAAAKQTTENQPFINLTNQRTLDFIKRCVLNTLSARFAHVYLSQAMGIKLKTMNFIFGITCEKYAEIRKHKIRIMLIAQDDLENYFLPGCDRVVDDDGKVTHRDRLKTLKVMGKLYKSKSCKHILGNIELGVAE